MYLYGELFDIACLVLRILGFTFVNSRELVQLSSSTITPPFLINHTLDHTLKQKKNIKLKEFFRHIN